MTPERWNAVMELFHAAHERTPPERTAFLAEACGDDRALYDEVASLLAAEEKASPFLAIEQGAEQRSAALAGRASVRDLPDRVQDALGDGYRVERELGGGGMSRVFVAQEVRLGRRVAVKVLPPDPGGPQVAERFLREARLIASLRHPHIVPLLVAGESADGLLYYTMPYVEGQSLGQWLAREGRLSLATVLAIVQEVAGALEYAHERGVIHRDIKPANVLMEGEHALVADFGIAKGAPADERREREGTTSAGNDSSTLTAAGFVLGTPAYMSPEQASGGHVDARSDVYSLGCLTFELLTGTRPFVDADAATPTRRAIDAPPSTRAHVAALPPAIDAVLLRAFAVRPEDRFASARAFAEALREAGSPPTTGLAAPAPLPPSRRPAFPPRALGLAAITLVAALLGRILLATPRRPASVTP